MYWNTAFTAVLFVEQCWAVAQWGQCGDNNGPNQSCDSGNSCQFVSQGYWQCKPDGSGGGGAGGGGPSVIPIVNQQAQQQPSQPPIGQQNPSQPANAWTPGPSQVPSSSSSSSQGNQCGDGTNGHWGSYNGQGTDIYGSDVCGNGGCTSKEQYCAAVAKNGQPEPCCAGMGSVQQPGGGGGPSSSSSAYVPAASQPGSSGSTTNSSGQNLFNLPVGGSLASELQQSGNSLGTNLLAKPGDTNLGGSGGDDDECDDGDDGEDDGIENESSGTLGNSLSRTGVDTADTSQQSGGANAFTSNSSVTPLEGGLKGVASTTHYEINGASVTACGCSGMWMAPGDAPIIGAAMKNPGYGGDTNGCGSNCGRCFSLTAKGTSPEGKGGTGHVTVMLIDACPADNAHWCAVPKNTYDYVHHFDLAVPAPAKTGPFGWDNPIVDFEEIPCKGSAQGTGGGSQAAQKWKRQNDLAAFHQNYLSCRCGKEGKGNVNPA